MKIKLTMLTDDVAGPLSPGCSCPCPKHDDYACSCKNMNTEQVSDRVWRMLNDTTKGAKLALFLSFVNLAAICTLIYLFAAK